MTVVADPSFTLHHRAEILAIVERLQRERVLATVEFDEGHALVTRILDVRRDTGSLVFDTARDADQQRRLFASRSLAFTTELDHVQIGFETGPASIVTLVDGPAAVVGLPVSVVRLQRREWFRAALPVEPPMRCTLLDREGHAMQAQAIDLSAGGAALLVGDAAAQTARTGSDHELILSLPDVGRLELDANLRSVNSMAGGPAGSPRKVRLGVRFSSVPSRTSNDLQRYVQRIEVEQLRILRRRGG